MAIDNEGKTIHNNLRKIIGHVHRSIMRGNAKHVKKSVHFLNEMSGIVRLNLKFLGVQ